MQLSTRRVAAAGAGAIVAAGAIQQSPLDSDARFWASVILAAIQAAVQLAALFANPPQRQALKNAIKPAPEDALQTKR
ncbi:MAG: hypothetical protein IT160_07140 [Bryobacterales bacterium]|nr:hypothetical protein [Bryobacterales bacterium]